MANCEPNIKTMDILSLVIAAGNGHLEAAEELERRTADTPEINKYDPSQPRRADGRWGTTGGDTAETPKWATKNPQYVVEHLEQQAENLNQDDIAEVDAYMEGGTFVGINYGLRGQAVDEDTANLIGLSNEALNSPETQAWIQDSASSLNSAIAKSTVMGEVKVMRSITSDVGDQMVKGTTFVEKGFASTTLDHNLVANWNQNGDIMQITIPHGTPALYIDAVKGSGFTPLGQKEILLQSGTQFAVTNVRTVEGRRIISVKVTGRT